MLLDSALTVYQHVIYMECFDYKTPSNGLIHQQILDRSKAITGLHRHECFPYLKESQSGGNIKA